MKIQGKALWASIQAPNVKYEPTYQIDLVIEDKQVAGAKKAGLKVKKTEDGNVVGFKRKVTRADGGQNKPPVVVDDHNRPILDLVGNGSLVNVQFSTYTYNNSFGSGVGADLQGVQVLELVEYSNDGGEFENESDEPDEVVVGDSLSDEVEKPAQEFDDDDLPDQL